jgi:hypothetical protein
MAARHGWIAKKGSGTSALATLNHLGHSVMVGHTHRQSLVYHTVTDIDGQTSTLVAAETGTMAIVEGGLGFTVSPDWQRGFCTVATWPDGQFHIEHATWAGEHLRWRNERF